MPSIRTLSATVVSTALFAASAACSAVPQDDVSSRQSESAQTPAAQALRGTYKLVDDPTKPFSVGAACNNPQLQYSGGQVISNVEIVQVVWGASVDPKITKLFESWYPALVTSAHLSWLSEYDTTSSGGSQHIGLGTYKKNPGSSGAWTITPANTSTALQDTDVGAEIVAQIAANHLPPPSKDAHGNSNTLYMIDFPPGVSITLNFFATSCKQFCGYHTTTTTAAGDKVYYGVHPDMSPGSGCSPSAGKWHCGGSLDEYVGSAVVHAHEMVEAITDPENNSAWVDKHQAQGCGEIGDICANQLGSCDASTCLSPSVGDLSISGGTYHVQTEWSNKQNDCIVQVGGTPVQDAGQDAGSDSGAGTDSAVPDVDAGTDASSAGDGAVQTDSGTTADSGSPDSGGDTGTPVPVTDSGTPIPGIDSGIPVIGGGDSGPAPGDGGEAADASTDGGGPGGSSGCGCVVAGGAERGSQAGALGGLLLGLAAVGRRRRSPR